MRKKNAFLAAAVIGALPLLMLLQQFLMPREKSVLPPHMLPQYDDLYLRASENALKYGEKRAAVVAQAAIISLKAGKLQQAENWCKLGALEYKHPSIMVLYADFLAGQKRFDESERWLKLAVQNARGAGKKDFLRIVEPKLRALQKQRGKK